MFADLDAYAHVKDAQKALDDYYATTTLNKRSTPTTPPIRKY
jgi:hypothetical protein